MDLCAGTVSSRGVEFHILLTANGQHYRMSHLIPRTSVGPFLIHQLILQSEIVLLSGVVHVV